MGTRISNRVTNVVSIVIVILTMVLVYMYVPNSAQANTFFGAYDSKYEQDSIRNQEEIIQLLREQNRLLRSK